MVLLMVDNENGKVGKVSGNIRVDPSTQEEHEDDTDDIFHLWVEELPNDDEFNDDIAEEVQKWKDIVTSTGCDPARLVIHVVGASHLDMAYKWRYEQTMKKAARTLAKAIRHARAVPGFKFATSSPQIMAWVKEQDPDLYADVQDFVKNGSIELVGGSWIEADCNMPSGEAFVRQRLLGMKLYRDEFGMLPEAEWYPDTFGYNAGLPQIFARSGARYFLTSKMTWCTTNDFPLVHFWWESPDGSRILVTSARTGVNVFSDFPRYGKFRKLPKAGTMPKWNYEDEFSELVASLDDGAWVTPVAVFTGKGDGGHGPTHQEVGSLLGFMNASKKLGLDMRWSSVHGYFKDVERVADSLLTWNDELYLEYHQGTFTTHPAIKRQNRRLECLLQAVETVATLTHVVDTSYEYPYDLLENAWKKVLLNQFHDVLPGSIIPEVLDDLVDSWDEVDANDCAVIDHALARFETGVEDNIQIFNPLLIGRDARVFIPATTTPPGEHPGADGQQSLPPAILAVRNEDSVITCPCQPVAAELEDLADHRPAGWWTVLTLPPLGIVSGRLTIAQDADGDHASDGIHVEAGETPCIDNGITRVELDARTGAITRLFSSDVNDGNNLLAGDENGLTIGFQDDDPEYPAWNLKENYWDFPRNYAQDDNVSIMIENEGDVFATLRVEKNLGVSIVRQAITLFKNDPAVYLYWHADWQEKNTMLKVTFTPETASLYSTSDQMYCAIKRKTNPETSGDKGRIEKPMQQYVDVSTPDNAWGIALLNEGKHGYDTLDGKLRLTMHKSSLYPEPAAYAWVHLERYERKSRDGSSVPTHSGLGLVSCRYALYPHMGGALASSSGTPTGQVKLVAEGFNQPAVVHVAGTIDPATALPVPDLAFTFPPNVLVTALKMREWERSSTIILRVAEITGNDTENVSVGVPSCIATRIATVEEMDLLERGIAMPDPWDVFSGKITFHVAPFEIKTFGLHLK